MAFKVETWIILSTPHSFAIRAIVCGPKTFLLIMCSITFTSIIPAFYIDVIKCKVLCLPFSADHIDNKVGVLHSLPDAILILEVVRSKVDLAQVTAEFQGLDIIKVTSVWNHQLGACISKLIADRRS